MARSAGGWLRSLSPSANPRPSGIPLPWEGGRWATHPPSPPFHGKGVDGLLIPLLPPSSGRRWRVAPEVGFALFRFRPTPCPSGVPLPREGDRWATHPASPSFLWKEVARSAGGWLRSLSTSANPRPSQRKGGWVTHPASPSFLGKEVAHSAPEVGFALFRLRPTPCPSGIPLPWEGGRWATHPASPSFLGKEVARSAGGWLRSFSTSANPRPSGIPLPWEGGRWTTRP